MIWHPPYPLKPTKERRSSDWAIPALVAGGESHNACVPRAVPYRAEQELWAAAVFGEAGQLPVDSNLEALAPGLIDDGDLGSVVAAIRGDSRVLA
jgi:hypothetical protein